MFTVILGFLPFVFNLNGLFVVDDFCSCSLFWFGFCLFLVLGGFFCLCVYLAWFYFTKKK